MGRVKVEAFGLLEPGFANELVRREALQGLEPSGEVMEVADGVRP